MKNKVLLVALLFFTNLKPVSENQAQIKAILNGIAVGVITGAVSSIVLSLDDFKVNAAISMIPATLAYWISYKSVMDSRPSVKIANLNSFLKEAENFFDFELDFKNGLNENLIENIKLYYKDSKKPLDLFSRDLEEIEKNIDSNIKLLENSRQDFIDSGLNNVFSVLRIKLDKLKKLILFYLLSVRIFNLKYFLGLVENDFIFRFDLKNGITYDLINKILSSKGKDFGNGIYNALSEYPLVIFIFTLDAAYRHIIINNDLLKKYENDFIENGFHQDVYDIELKLSEYKIYIENLCSSLKKNEIFDMQFRICVLEQDLKKNSYRRWCKIPSLYYFCNESYKI
ncbi:MAG: hypothetical protein ABIF12_00615 [bacterium]